MSNDLELDSAREATIKIKNFSDHDMKLSEGMKLCHGEFITEATKEIPNKGEGEFKIGSKNSIGAKGWLSYDMAVSGKVETMRIFFHHPVGSAKSRYECSFEPFKISIDQDPTVPTGSRQTITLTIKEVLTGSSSKIPPIDCDH
jgi:hypothetical protein